MHPSQVFGYLFDYGVDVLVTVLDKTTGVITAMLGDSSTDTPDSDQAEWWQHTGFTSRPALPTQGSSSCQAVILRRSDRDVIIATRDVRGTGIYGNLADGETCVYAAGSQARAVYKADGSARAMTTDDNTADGNVIFSGISSYYTDPGTQKPAKGGEWRVYAPWGGQWQDPSGWHLRTWHGVKIDAGGTVFPSLGGVSIGKVSSLTISADSLILDAAILQLGRDTGTANSVVQAVSLQTLMASHATDIATFCAALNVYFTGIKAIVDPTNALTPVVEAAVTQFQLNSASLFATIQVATQTRTTLA